MRRRGVEVGAERDRAPAAREEPALPVPWATATVGIRIVDVELDCDVELDEMVFFDDDDAELLWVSYSDGVDAAVLIRTALMPAHVDAAVVEIRWGSLHLVLDVESVTKDDHENGLVLWCEGPA